MELYRRVESIVRDTLKTCVELGDLALAEVPAEVAIEKPKRSDHGDFATTICLQLARPARKNPREIARSVLMHLQDPDGLLESAEMAGPGFINFRIRDEVWLETLRGIAAAGDTYGQSQTGAGKRVLVEFVSANPTGPLHVGHGRGAVIGDAVASLLQAVGYEVDREYYINDVGNQMNILGRSLFVRYQQACGRDVELPENHYVGVYISEIAQRFKAEHGETYVDADFEADRDFWIAAVKDEILVGIRKDLGRLGVNFDRWYSERSLHEAGRLLSVVDKLRAAGHVYDDEDGKVWFRSTAFGDEDDRVVVRDTGVPTYFAADIAYHDEKLERGYDLAIDVWGADHHGYIPRVKAALEALGHDPARLEVLLYQFVSLVEDGVQVRMTTRGGKFETLVDLLEDVGEDATRCNFVMRKSDAQFEFDLKLAKSQSLDNPVYYVQYGHARLCSIISKAEEAGHSVPGADVDLSPLTLPEELELIKRSHDYPWVVQSAAANRAPHHVVFYLQELIGKFHGYYTKYKHSERVITDDAAKTAARLFLCDALRAVLANALALLGVSAPERMYFTE